MLRLWLIVLLWPAVASACGSWTVGFSGLRDEFDHAAFVEWAQTRTECHRVYAWHQRQQSLRFVQSLSVPYELYGFSKGAETVLWLMPRVKTGPRYVITIGGWSTVNFDFSRWNTPFDNWFDWSGAGNPAPGRHVPGVPHHEMQAWVNKFYQTPVRKMEKRSLSKGDDSRFESEQGHH